MAASQPSAKRTGMGIRLDGGTAYSGGVITRYYDSLLIKLPPTPKRPKRRLPAWTVRCANSVFAAVSTNIAFVENLLKHPTFLSNEYTTTFIDETPICFISKSAVTARTKVLTYIADITVNGHPETTPPEPACRPERPASPACYKQSRHRHAQPARRQRPASRCRLDEAQKQLLLTDTTMRDGHQSLACDADALHRHDQASRPPMRPTCRSFSRLNAGAARPLMWPTASCRNAHGSACATLRARDAQRDDTNAAARLNGVGYTNYPDNVVKEFVRQARQTGVDVFRVFDSLNWVENMRVAMDAVIEATESLRRHDLLHRRYLDPDRAKYDLKYYVNMAKELKPLARMSSA